MSHDKHRKGERGGPIPAMGLVHADFVDCHVALEELFKMELGRGTVEGKERTNSSKNSKTSITLPGEAEGGFEVNKVVDKQIKTLAAHLNGIRGLTKREWNDLMNQCVRLKMGYKLTDEQRQRVEELTDLVLSMHKLCQ